MVHCESLLRAIKVRNEIFAELADSNTTDQRTLTIVEVLTAERIPNNLE